ncbi:MAG TPA: hypothetical protein VHT75_01980 [Acidimicrobiales bacterium]|nr:hypothetical protein [Acidimicrobiales bacterium]
MSTPQRKNLDLFQRAAPPLGRPTRPAPPAPLAAAPGHLVATTVGARHTNSPQPPPPTARPTRRRPRPATLWRQHAAPATPTRRNLPHRPPDRPAGGRARTHRPPAGAGG